MKIKFLLIFLFCTTFAFSKDSVSLKFQVEIQNLKQENENLHQNLTQLQNDYEKLSVTYQHTNDRLNNYLTFTGIVASIFGVLIALAGIYIGFESLKSQNKRKEAIKTLEKAKKYVQDKKVNFDGLIENKKVLLQEEYDKFVQLFKDKLVSDIELETSKIKDIASKKSEEIQNFSIEEKNNKTLEILEKRLEFFENVGIPDDPEILFSKAKLLSEKDMISEAILLFEKLINKEPNHNMAYWHLGFEYSKQNNIDKSIEYYTKHLEINPTSSGAMNNIALEYKKKENYLKALEYFDKAISISPKDGLYLRNRINLLLNLNSVEKVIEDYKTLIELDNSIEKNYVEIIKHLKNENRIDDVIYYYDKAITLLNEESSNKFIFSKAQFLSDLNRTNEAIEILQKLIDSEYKIESCYIKIADIKEKIGKTDDALEILDNGISNNPLSSHLYIHKAIIQNSSKKGNPKETIDLGLFKIESENYCFLAGQTFNKRGFYDLADYSYELALRTIENKLIDEEDNEGNLLNKLETLIILRKPITDYKNEIDQKIISEKYQVVFRFLVISNELISNPNTEKLNSLKDELAQINLEAKEQLDINWNFNDILYSVKRLNNKYLFDAIEKSIKYIKGEIKLSEINYYS